MGRNTGILSRARQDTREFGLRPRLGSAANHSFAAQVRIDSLFFPRKSAAIRQGKQPGFTSSLASNTAQQSIGFARICRLVRSQAGALAGSGSRATDYERLQKPRQRPELIPHLIPRGIRFQDASWQMAPSHQVCRIPTRTTRELSLFLSFLLSQLIYIRR